jgi:hypothetical protein
VHDLQVHDLQVIVEVAIEVSDLLVVEVHRGLVHHDKLVMVPIHEVRDLRQ